MDGKEEEKDDERGKKANPKESTTHSYSRMINTQVPATYEREHRNRLTAEVRMERGGGGRHDGGRVEGK